MADKQMMAIEVEVLEVLLFQVYFRGNISTGKAANILDITVIEFIEKYDIWNDQD